MERGGMDIGSAARQIDFTLTTDADLFLSIAKIRALRKMWARVMEASGASPENRTASVNAITAPRMMSQRDPWVNILRTTVACFGAGIAGAEAITVLPFDSALGLPGDLGRRIARNTHTVLQEESALARVIDPAGGAWMFETLTDELAGRAWAFFQEIEREGGMVQALLGGFISGQFAGVQAERRKALARRKQPLTGVSEFPHVHEEQIRPIAPSPVKRDSASTAVALPPAGDGVLTKALIDAVAKHDVASIVAGLKGGTGASITPLPTLRLAQDFEQLRDASDAFKAKHGHRPKVYLANLDSVAAFTGRATFAKNFYEAGGFETVSGSGGTDLAAITRDFKTSGAPFAVICSTDAVYAAHAANLAQALKAAGASVVHLAGRGGEQEAALKAAGVDDFISIGCDVLGVLAALHDRTNGSR